MGRYRGRGRPPKNREKRDLGTKELQQKRALGHTDEVLDYCHQRGIISDAQHWCGNHFRWLYTMRYGVPNIRATDFARLGLVAPPEDDDEWLARINVQYMQATELLEQRRCLGVVLNAVVYSQCEERPVAKKHDLEVLRSALEILVDLWCGPVNSLSH